MILLALFVLPLLAGLVAWPLGRRQPAATRWICVVALAVELVLVVAAWSAPESAAGWRGELDVPWLPALGIGLHLGADGLSLPLLALTAVLGLAAVAASWREIDARVGFFHLNLMAVLSGVAGVFLALDLFLFAFCWELMLVPMALLIAIWGHEGRERAAIKFFLFTQASGLLMLLAILTLAFLHARTAGAPSFDYADLLQTPVGGTTGMLLMLGFVVAFAVKLPAVPLHTWLPDAHTEAPTAGSVVLAGLMLKTGAYGLLRFALPLFPEASADFAPVAQALGTLGIVYGGVLAFAQTDLKRLVAYTSVSHLGFVLLGVYTFERLAQQGAVVQMLAHGLSTGGLFILVGVLQERTGTRELARLGGLWRSLPRLGGVGMVLAMASLGLPGLANFVAEFLVLLGAWPVAPVATVIAACGLVFAAAYSLRLVQRTFHGEDPQARSLPDLGAREAVVFAGAIVLLVWLGVYPQPLLDSVGPVLERMGVTAMVGGG